jgi:hypothetical protein
MRRGQRMMLSQSRIPDSVTDIRGGSPKRKNEKPVSVSKGTAAEGHTDVFELEDLAIIARKSVCQHVNSIAVEGHTYRT